jgi:hypothetical protein
MRLFLASATTATQSIQIKTILEERIDKHTQKDTATQADKNLEKRVYTLQSGTAIVTHSRSKKEHRFSRVSRFFALSFQFLSLKTTKKTGFEH